MYNKNDLWYIVSINFKINHSPMRTTLMHRSFLILLLINGLFCYGQSKFEMEDIFSLQYASDIQLSPDGKKIVYRKMGFDIMEDKSMGALWMMNADGSNNQKLTSRDQNESSPIWSPKGDQIAFVSAGKNGSEIYIYWIDSGKFARITQLPKSPSSLTWSNDVKHLAFSMFVHSPPPVIAKIPQAPKGANWSKKPRITDRLKHEADGRGYLPPGFNHLFVVPATGGAVRQVTSGDFHHRGKISWSKDNRSLFSANRNADWEYDFRNSEIYRVSINDGNIQALTERDGPDALQVFLLTEKPWPISVLTIKRLIKTPSYT